MSSYRICTNCIMDTTDPEIEFDEEGVCSHCLQFYQRKDWFPGIEGKDKLNKIIKNIKITGRNKEYDCILGLSGGVDSSFLALKAKEWGLRPLVFHVDAGWNSELAVANIEKVVKYCNYDLKTYVVDWESMRDLHISYLKSGIANQDIPQDHIFFASQYHYSIKSKSKIILSGGNIATESIFPTSWHNSAMDAINLKDIHRRFGSKKKLEYKTISFYQYYIWYPLFRSLRTIRPLNYMNYNYNNAVVELSTKTGWTTYGRKHGESVFTKLFQNYILPRRFGFDKRKIHFSSMIVSGQMKRSDALQKMTEPLYEDHELQKDIDYFCKKLRISREEFNIYLDQPLKYYSSYANWDKKLKFVKYVQNLAEKLTGRRFRVYS